VFIVEDWLSFFFYCMENDQSKGRHSRFSTIISLANLAVDERAAYRLTQEPRLFKMVRSFANKNTSEKEKRQLARLCFNLAEHVHLQKELWDQLKFDTFTFLANDQDTTTSLYALSGLATLTNNSKN